MAYGIGEGREGAIPRRGGPCAPDLALRLLSFFVLLIKIIKLYFLGLGLFIFIPRPRQGVYGARSRGGGDGKPSVRVVICIDYSETTQ